MTAGAGRSTRDAVAPWLGAALFTVFAVVYAFTSGAFVHWLDSGELSLAGATLGIPHPPGHPGYVMLSHAAALLPIGTVAFRTALLSGLLAAGSVALVYRLGATLAAVARGRDTPTAGDVATAATMAVVFGISSALWLNAVRAEVYTLQLFCALLTLLWAVRWSLDPADHTALRWAALAAGFGLTNHHYLMVLLGPALLVTALGRRDHRAVFRTQIGWVLGLGALPLLTYGLLPIRASADALLNFGDPSSAERFWAVLTAQQFQGSVSAVNVSVMSNLGVALEMIIRSVGMPVIALALLGLAGLGTRRRHLAVVMTVAIAGNLASKVVMDLDPQNPDADGYLLLSFGLFAAMAAAGAGGIYAWVKAPGGRVASAVAVATAICVAVASLAPTARRSDLDGTHATAALDSVTTGRMSPGALALTSFYTLHFNRQWYAAVEGYRSDVEALQVGLDRGVDGGRSLDRWASRHAPGARSLTRAHVATGRWPQAETLQLANIRPVYIEPTFSGPIPPHRTEYASLYMRVRRAGARRSSGLREQAVDAERLEVLTRGELRRLLEPRKMLLLVLLQVAVVRLKQLEPAGAKMALDMVDVISPRNPYSRRLVPLVRSMMDAVDSRDITALRRVAGEVASTDFANLVFGRRSD